MITCSQCGSPLQGFLMCPTCGKGFCPKEKTTFCPFCQDPLTAALVTTEKRQGTTEISWIAADGGRIGLVGFTEVPKEAPETLTSLRNIKPIIPFEVIIFPDKNLSNNFRSSVYPDVALKGFKLKEPPQGSRFSVLYAPTGGLRIILLNIGSIESGAISFTLSLVLSPELDDAPIRAMIGRKKVLQTFLGFLGNYNSKLGVPFVSENQHTKELYITAVIGLNQSYGSFQALRSVVSSNTLNEAAEHVGRQLDLSLGSVEWDIIHLLDEAIGLLWKIISVRTTMAAVSHEDALKSRVQVIFARHLNDIQGKLVKRPDLLKAIGCIIDKLESDSTYSSRASYIDACCAAFSESVRFLSVGYSRMDEMLELAIAVKHLRSQVESHQSVPTSRFGNLNHVIRILSSVFEKDYAYPELAILSGDLLLSLNQSLMLSSYDYAAYRNALRIGRRLSNITELHYDEVKQHNPLSPIGREEIALPLLSLAAAAKMFDDSQEAHLLEQESRVIIDRYNLVHLECLLDWNDFLVSQDFDFLLKIYRGFQRAMSEEVPGLDDHTRFLGHLASAVFEQEKCKAHLDLAREYAVDMRAAIQPTRDSINLLPDLAVPAPEPLSDFLAHHSGEISLYFAELFETILDIDSQGVTQERLKRAKIFAVILKEELSSIHPGQTLALKTLSLLALLQGDVEDLSGYLSDLRALSGSERNIANFVQLCTIWVSRERVKLKLVRSLESHIDNRDPWIRVALLFVNAQLKSQLRGVNIFDFDALIFVEGRSDERIFQKLAKRVAPKLRLMFIGAQGWPSFEYFANAAIATRVNRSVTVIFDGDTSEGRFKEIKGRLVAALRSSPKVITLKRPSIESYLLIPRSIKAAFPTLSLSEKQIANYIQSNKSKDKKSVLKMLLEKYAGVKYDSTVGAKIASKMRLVDIDPELREIFSGLEIGPNTQARTGRETKAS